jgi:hypothetical protein
MSCHMRGGQPVCTAGQNGLHAHGWNPCHCCSRDEADRLVALVADWPIGCVVERRLDELRIRALLE